jgi:hypothetical protein
MGKGKRGEQKQYRAENILITLADYVRRNGVHRESVFSLYPAMLFLKISLKRQTKSKVMSTIELDKVTQSSTKAMTEK